MNELLSRAVGEIKKRSMNVYSVTVVSDGKSETVHIKEDSCCRDVYSVSKAYTMAAVGFLFDEGKLKPEDSVADVFGRLPEGSCESWMDATVHDALRHRMGLLRDFIDIDSIDMSVAGDDWLGYLFSQQPEGVRGEDYFYTDAAYYLLSRFVSAKCGCSLYDYLRVKLFNPLHFREVAWSTCPKGYSVGGSGLFVSCEDMTKLGQLWLDGGVFEGKRIISEEWIAKTLENEYAFSPRYKERGCYYKTGAHGQMLYFSQSEAFTLGIQSYVPSGEMTELIDILL